MKPTATWIRATNGSLINLAFITSIEVSPALRRDDARGECTGARVVAWTEQNGPSNLTDVLLLEDAELVLDGIVDGMTVRPIVDVQTFVDEIVQLFGTPETDAHAEAVASEGGADADS